MEPSLFHLFHQASANHIKNPRKPIGHEGNVEDGSFDVSNPYEA